MFAYRIFANNTSYTDTDKSLTEIMVKAVSFLNELNCDSLVKLTFTDIGRNRHFLCFVLADLNNLRQNNEFIDFKMCLNYEIGNYKDHIRKYDTEHYDFKRFYF